MRNAKMAFGWLKGRWAFCTQNKTYKDPLFVCECIEASCSVHNIVEARGVQFDVEDMREANAFELPDVGDAPPSQLQAGNALRYTVLFPKESQMRFPGQASRSNKFAIPWAADNKNKVVSDLQGYQRRRA
jgi:hypothetical protein